MESEEAKTEIYEAMATINRAFHQIVGALTTLEARGIIPPDYLQDQDIIVHDLWAKINCQVLAGVATRETEDRDHYGKMRATLERTNPRMPIARHKRCTSATARND
jgi:hypothetical protein